MQGWFSAPGSLHAAALVVACSDLYPTCWRGSLLWEGHLATSCFVLYPCAYWFSFHARLPLWAGFPHASKCVVGGVGGPRLNLNNSWSPLLEDFLASRAAALGLGSAGFASRSSGRARAQGRSSRIGPAQVVHAVVGARPAHEVERQPPPLLRGGAPLPVAQLSHSDGHGGAMNYESKARQRAALCLTGLDPSP